MIVLLDNYDSFTYNLFQYLSELGQEVKVLRNNETSIKEIEILSPSHLVISPGPSNPENAGISNDSIQYFSKIIPVLGVCLGHQCLGNTYGAKIIQINTFISKYLIRTEAKLRKAATDFEFLHVF